MKDEEKTVVQTSMASLGLPSFTDLAAIVLIARKLQLNRTMHANMLYHSYLRLQRYAGSRQLVKDST